MKINYKTTVYRAIYYSGFDWSKVSSTSEQVDYKLVSKKSNFTIYLTHKSVEDLDVIIAKTQDNLTEDDTKRFKRLCQKIYRRTKNLKIEQDIVDLVSTTNDVPTEEKANEQTETNI